MRRLLPWVGVILGVVLLPVAIFFALAEPTTTEPPTLTHTTTEDGRICTTATTATSVAIDCEYPPAENRFGGWLEDLNTKP